MNSLHRWLAIAALSALGSALGVACSEDETKEPDLCEEVRCLDPATTCDPTDGICKCGTDDSRIVCKSNEVCQVTGDGIPFCAQDRCVGVVCEKNETCDPTDGVCKCGTSTCSEGEVCRQNRCTVPDPCAGLICPEGQTCDPSDGHCKCGGEVCADNERCDDGVCVEDPCKGVNCAGYNVCNPEDRACHCGTITGEVCQNGESCELEDGEFVCKAGENKCQNVDCPGDSVCDPDDGSCRCGGIGPDYPICADDEVCYLGRCVGGSICSKVECEPGFECNPTTGLCECGGELCASDQTCMALDEGSFQCVDRCDPLVFGECGEGFVCYVDVRSGATVGYCAPEGNTALGSPCELPHECQSGATCTGSTTTACYAICDTRPGAVRVCDPGFFCHPQADPIGVCVPVP